MPVHAVDALADALASTSTHLYWLDASMAVMRMPKAGGTFAKLTGMQSRGGHIVVDDARVYWEETDAQHDQNLFSRPLDDSASPVELAVGAGAWAVGADRVFYWKPGTGGSSGEIDSVPKTGGAPTMVTQRASVIGSTLAADDKGIYWFDDRQADLHANLLTSFLFAKSGGSGLSRPKVIRYLVANGHDVLWTEEDAYLEPADILWTTPSVWTPNTTVSAQPVVLGFVADDTTAYWLSGGPAAALGPADVLAADIQGGNVRKLACNVDSPVAMTVGDDAVYVSTAGSVIWKIAKN
jgi:hypothetical protein